MGTWRHPSERRCGAKWRNCIQCLGCTQCSPCPRADFVPKQFLIRGLLLEGPSSSGAIIFHWGHLPSQTTSITDISHHSHLPLGTSAIRDAFHPSGMSSFITAIFYHGHLLSGPSPSPLLSYSPVPSLGADNSRGPPMSLPTQGTHVSSVPPPLWQSGDTECFSSFLPFCTCGNNDVLQETSAGTKLGLVNTG